VICASVRPALEAVVCIGWPFLSSGPIELPYRSRSTTADRTRLAPRSVPRALGPWQVTHSAA
jgi:hypothetical protein